MLESSMGIEQGVLNKLRWQDYLKNRVSLYSKEIHKAGQPD